MWEMCLCSHQTSERFPSGSRESGSPPARGFSIVTLLLAAVAHLTSVSPQLGLRGLAIGEVCVCLDHRWTAVSSLLCFVRCGCSFKVCIWVAWGMKSYGVHITNRF